MGNLKWLKRNKECINMKRYWFGQIKKIGLKHYINASNSFSALHSFVTEGVKLFQTYTYSEKSS